MAKIPSGVSSRNYLTDLLESGNIKFDYLSGDYHVTNLRILELLNSKDGIEKEPGLRFFGKIDFTLSQYCKRYIEGDCLGHISKKCYYHNIPCDKFIPKFD